MKQKKTDDNYVEINAKIIPKASRNEIIEENESVKIRVTSPPVDGKANKAVIDLLSKQLIVSKKDIQIVSGEKSRNKKIRIHGITYQDFLKNIG